MKPARKRDRKPLKARHDRCPACIVGGLTRGAPALDGRPSFDCQRCGHRFTNGKDGGEYMANVPAGFVNFSDAVREHVGGQSQYLSRYVDGRSGCPVLGDGLRFEGVPRDYHDLMIHCDDVMEFVRRLRERGVTG